MGVTKTQDRARSTFFWVGISKEIENVIGNCEVCQKYAKRQPKECQGHVQDISEAGNLQPQICLGSRAIHTLSSHVGLVDIWL